MKNEPTQLERFQQERIKALEAEVIRLNTQLVQVEETLRKTALKITVSNPDFLQPLDKIEFEFITPEHHG